MDDLHHRVFFPSFCHYCLTFVIGCRQWYFQTDTINNCKKKAYTLEAGNAFLIQLMLKTSMRGGDHIPSDESGAFFKKDI